MFFAVSQELANCLKSMLEDAFSEEEFQKGIEAFENLINIEDDKSDFNQEYGLELNKSNFLAPEWNFDLMCKLEGFFKKLEMLKGNNDDEITLKEYYIKLGFFDWLNEEDIKMARANDAINSIHSNNLNAKDGFQLAEADASQYKKCSHHFYSYIIAYQLRNRVQKYDNKDFCFRFEKIKSLFIVYIDQCIKNGELINESYEKELLSKRIDYVKFANERMGDYQNFNREFLQLAWCDEKDAQFAYEFNSCVKFIGEAGMGKTTQMRKMYFELLDSVSKNERSVLPLWIKLSDMNEIQDISLEEKVKNLLGEYGQYYELLLKRNVIVLFLDGYNEIVLNDKNEVVKKRLARDVDDIHKEYPQTIIAMTDRRKKSTPSCLIENVKVFTLSGFSKKEISDYISLKTDGEMLRKIMQYINGKGAEWINHINIIPAKINSLIELISNDIIPSSEDDFYDKYLEFILEREEYEKKETRIAELKYSLYILAQNLNHPQDEKSHNEIINLWKENCFRDVSEALRIFDLATELPILVPGVSDNAYRFAYSQYYFKIQTL